MNCAGSAWHFPKKCLDFVTPDVAAWSPSNPQSDSPGFKLRTPVRYELLTLGDELLLGLTANGHLDLHRRGAGPPGGELARNVTDHRRGRRDRPAIAARAGDRRRRHPHRRPRADLRRPHPRGGGGGPGAKAGLRPGDREDHRRPFRPLWPQDDAEQPEAGLPVRSRRGAAQRQRHGPGPLGGEGRARCLHSARAARTSCSPCSSTRCCPGWRRLGSCSTRSLHADPHRRGR